MATERSEGAPKVTMRLLIARTLDCPPPWRRSTPLTDDRPLRVRRRLPREQGGDRAERGSTGSSSRARLLR